MKLLLRRTLVLYSRQSTIVSRQPGVENRWLLAFSLPLFAPGKGSMHAQAMNVVRRNDDAIITKAGHLKL